MTLCRNIYSSLRQLLEMQKIAKKSLHQSPAEVRSVMTKLSTARLEIFSRLFPTISNDVYAQQLTYLRKRPGYKKVRANQQKFRALVDTEVGLIFVNAKGEEVILGIDGREYPVPTYEQILQKHIARCVADPEYTKLVDTGYTRLLLVPRAASLDEIIWMYENSLADKFRAYTLHRQGIDLQHPGVNVKGRAEDLVECHPSFYVDRQSLAKGNGIITADLDAGVLQYGPENYTKAQLLAEAKTTFPGWDVMLVHEDLRMQKLTLEEVDTWKEGIEEPLDIDTWLILANSIAEEYHQVIDDVAFSDDASYGIGMACALLGTSFFGNAVPPTDRLVLAYWEGEKNQVGLGLWNRTAYPEATGVRTMLRL